eukprot:15864-Heterococcus_DN1.PRE.8
MLAGDTNCAYAACKSFFVYVLLQLLAYDAVMSLQSSDHRPVYATVCMTYKPHNSSHVKEAAVTNQTTSECITAATVYYSSAQCYVDHQRFSMCFSISAVVTLDSVLSAWTSITVITPTAAVAAAAPPVKRATTQ